MTHRRAAQAGALLFAMAVAKTAEASQFELTWVSSSREGACVAEDALRRAVSARLRRDPFVPRGQGDVVIEGRELEARAGHLRAQIAQRDREGRLLGTRSL